MKKNIFKKQKSPKLDWRTVWYSVLIWISTIIIGGFVFLPWFYLALPITILVLISYYFKSGDKTLIVALRVSLFWFFSVLILDFLEIIGPYYLNASLYFSDFRNWLKYPLILLIPPLYSLIFESIKIKKIRKSHKPLSSGTNITFITQSRFL